jgi:ectoine hydroxylase-related dioxygenase (phytanoyl-CoA dioxygenase family)
MRPELRDEVNRCGAAVGSLGVENDLVDQLRAETDQLVVGSGLRFALDQLAAGRVVAEGAMLALARALIGDEARIVRSILFDKTAASNWLVPWHQDVTIAVRERRDVPGFGPWSVKEGVVHVQPPAAVLEGMVTIRLHLDDTPAENGALRALTGSHRNGVLSAADIGAFRERGVERVCEARLGDVVVMKPLVLHASSKSKVPGRRRVLHVEFAAGELPGGLCWAEG